eukprot:15484668-Alexandrium_andersonii.AAC.1
MVAARSSSAMEEAGNYGDRQLADLLANAEAPLAARLALETLALEGQARPGQARPGQAKARA